MPFQIRAFIPIRLPMSSAWTLISSGASDARLAHLSKMIDNFEPTDELAPEIHLPINTDNPLRDSLVQILSDGYANKAEQIKKALSL